MTERPDIERVFARVRERWEEQRHQAGIGEPLPPGIERLYVVVGAAVIAVVVAAILLLGWRMLGGG